MAVEKLGTENDPDVKVQGSAVNIVPDKQEKNKYKQKH